MTGDDWETTPFPEFTEQQVAAIVKRSPVADVIGEHTSITAQADGTFAGVCPFCSGLRSLHAVPETGRWQCYSCLECGDVIVFICKMRDLWRADAIQWLEHRMASRSAPAVPARLKSEEPPYNVQGTAPENTL
ncbi:hypothetical protein GCM10017673_40310 [Streptosporangium violaceochromogenes]|nr:hypothetical protein GCM10017673_40310 [Streptosporangium violaceochromogenes]